MAMEEEEKGVGGEDASLSADVPGATACPLPVGQCSQKQPDDVDKWGGGGVNK